MAGKSFHFHVVEDVGVVGLTVVVGELQVVEMRGEEVLKGLVFAGR